MRAAQRGTALAPQLGGLAAAEAGPAGSPTAPCLPLCSDQPATEAPTALGVSRAHPFLWPQIVAEVLAHVSPRLPVALAPRASRARTPWEWVAEGPGGTRQGAGLLPLTGTQPLCLIVRY